MTRGRPYATALWACALLAAATPHAAELALGEASAQDGLVAVPLLLVPGPGEPVASLQVDIVAGAGYAVHGITAAPAALGAGKDVVYAGGPDRTTVIVAGFNQQPMEAGTIATLYLAPAGDSAGPLELALARGVISDPRGQALPVELRSGHKAVDSAREQAGPARETDRSGAATPAPQSRDTGTRAETDAASGGELYAGLDGGETAPDRLASARAAMGSAGRIPDGRAAGPHTPGGVAGRVHPGTPRENGTPPEGWMMRPQPPLMIRRLEQAPEGAGSIATPPESATAGSGAAADPLRTAALGAHAGRGMQSGHGRGADTGGTPAGQRTTTGGRGWTAVLLLAGCLTAAALARRRLFRKG